ncbi:NrfD/PsrC family molybdoenzyme membrane anchor subunit [Sulfurospirillum arcachonense]|uniref:NrfD/PsrC family molybdoenzyme membrane anchor subunit n=1 Tax=Sulfurospirillum arcachonense TaxID=57666 RepID=UPI000468E59C|nr:NrfD/PsrC family molybdoenzyme membrane anchor subunit [Sulfurospirillum arcachonense]
MEKIIFAGLTINKVSIKDLLFNKVMLLSYILLGLACVGILEIFDLRYFSEAATAHASGMDPTNPALKEAMKLAVFGTVGEVSREVPWTLFIVNYMYMIYTGSGIIFLVALAELMNMHLVAKVAAGFMVTGISMVFAGLFTIATDLNMLNMLWMILTPNVNTGMWLMLPLYCTYIPFVLFEIYLILTNKRELAKRLALPILVLSIGVDLVEYFIQAKLFSMNTARHLWTEFPVLMFYFIISAFVSSLGIMGVYSYLVHKNKFEYKELMEKIRKAMLFFISILAIYEVFGYMAVDKDWTFLILFGPFKYVYFLGYILLALALPFLLVIKPGKPIWTLISSISVVIGGYVGRFLFVYGGNANPMSNRFGTGYETYDFYDIASHFNYVKPHLGEILIVFGSVGVCLLIYKLFDSLFSIGDLREH